MPALDVTPRPRNGEGSLRVRRARAEDHDAVVSVLARAFDSDPMVRYLLRQDGRRTAAYRLCFSAFFRHMCLPHGEVWLEEEGRGAALWTPPGAWQVSLARTIAMGPSLISAAGPARILRSARAMARVQAIHPARPHYYLFALGVDPDAQGRGIGSAILTKVLELCDKDGVGAYLEASTASSARLYARSGFRGEDEFRMAEDAPPIWPMWRDPASHPTPPPPVLGPL
jgi:ribosomal protein S18 acetylase RimI-like enzyme